ncbi:MAG: transglycosylase family protein, partial [Jatrophihabitans sp.]
MGIDYRPGSAAPFFAEWTEENDSRPGLARRLKEKRPTKNWGVAAATATLIGVLASGVVSPGTSASADPSSNDWYRLRMCESSNNYSINTGNAHYGAYQFDV